VSPRRLARLLTGVGAVAFVLIFAVTVIVVHRRSGGSNLAATAAGLVPGALLHAHNFHWTQMKAGRSEWTLRARDASYADDKTSITLVNPELSMIAADGKQVNLTARRARLRIDGSHIKSAEMSGGLVVHYGDFVLTTDRASFVPDQDQLDAPGPVKVESPDLIVTGVGLSGHPKAETFNLRSQVTTQITPRQKRATAKIS
jgi:LPS export ABC transporter protein LptC